MKALSLITFLSLISMGNHLAAAERGESKRSAPHQHSSGAVASAHSTEPLFVNTDTSSEPLRTPGISSSLRHLYTSGSSSSRKIDTTHQDTHLEHALWGICIETSKLSAEQHKLTKRVEKVEKLHAASPRSTPIDIEALVHNPRLNTHITETISGMMTHHFSIMGQDIKSLLERINGLDEKISTACTIVKTFETRLNALEVASQPWPAAQAPTAALASDIPHTSEELPPAS